MEKRLYRSRTDKQLAGVCGGFAKFFGIDPTIIRLLWALLCVCAGTGVLAYLVCAFVIPEEPDNIIDID